MPLVSWGPLGSFDYAILWWGGGMYDIITNKSERSLLLDTSETFQRKIIAPKWETSSCARQNQNVCELPHCRRDAEMFT